VALVVLQLTDATGYEASNSGMVLQPPEEDRPSKRAHRKEEGAAQAVSGEATAGGSAPPPENGASSSRPAVRTFSPPPLPLHHAADILLEPKGNWIRMKITSGDCFPAHDQAKCVASQN